jgi:hypothetical protein
VLLSKDQLHAKELRSNSFFLENSDQSRKRHNCPPYRAIGPANAVWSPLRAPQGSRGRGPLPHNRQLEQLGRIPHQRYGPSWSIWISRIYRCHIFPYQRGRRRCKQKESCEPHSSSARIQQKAQRVNCCWKSAPLRDASGHEKWDDKRHTRDYIIRGQYMTDYGRHTPGSIAHQGQGH